jgi:hypothetical protein
MNSTPNTWLRKARVLVGETALYVYGQTLNKAMPGGYLLVIKHFFPPL